MVKLDFGDVIEDVVTRDEFPLDYARRVLGDGPIAVLGYGIQGRGQSLNMRDNGFSVVVGQRESYAEPGEKPTHWENALNEGWIPGETLFSSLEEAANRGRIKQYLLHDAGQKEQWPIVKETLKAGDALVFSHGFSIVYKNQTGVIPPKDVDVILVAPKGSGTSLRRNFEAGRGINSSYAVYQDATGKAEERVKAIGIAIGSGYLFPTTFEKEVYSDLTGERAVLMGLVAGAMEAQYDVLRSRGHSPSEAFNETVEELTQSLIPLIAENGMDWMFNNCSETARIGALRWKNRFKGVLMPVIDSLYDLVASGEETRIVLEESEKPDYRRNLANQLKQMGSSEMWKTGKTVRSLRPENQKKE